MILSALAGEHAPTAVKDPSEAVNVHIADALSGLKAVTDGAHGVIADIGSGCGVPALVLAVALPQSQVVAVESQRRKCDFIEESAADAGITNLTTAWARAEEWFEGIDQCDVVTSRALADLPVVLEYSAPLLSDCGRAIAWKGRLEDGELERGTAAAKTLNLTPPHAATVEPWEGGGRRHIVTTQRDGDLPDGFPRRAGMATKRPLGS